MKRMEEENQVNSYLVTDKFPRQLNQMKTKLKYYEEVTNNKALGQTELSNYRAKVNEYIFFLYSISYLFILD
jgi:intraflagellar transport protein 81